LEVYMQTALSVLSKYDFKQLRPGENDAVFKFSGPGIVVIACQNTSVAPSEIMFSIITALSADPDALEVAHRLLKQKWTCNGYVFAMLAPVKDEAERLEAIATLSSRCSAGI